MEALGMAALWLFVFSVPWENAVMVSGVGTLSRTIGLVAAPIAAIAIALRSRLHHNSFSIAFGIFVAYIAFSIHWNAVSFTASWNYALLYMQMLVMVLILYQFMDTRERVMMFLRAYVIGACITAISTIQAYHAGVAEDYQRYAAANFDANDTAIILALGIPMAWYLALVEKRIVDFCLLAYVPLGLIAILLTASRAGTMAAAVATTAPVWIAGRRFGLAAKVFTILLIVGIAAVSISYAPQSSLNRISTIFDEVSGGTLNYRTVIWSRVFNIFAENPWLGVGVGNLREFTSGRSAHNVFLAIAADLGVLGFILFMGCLVCVVKKVIEMPVVERRIWYLLLGVLVVAMLSLNWEWRKQMWVILVLATAHAEVVAARGFDVRALRAGSAGTWSESKVRGQARA